MQSASRNDTPHSSQEAARPASGRARVAAAEPVIWHDLDGLAVQRNDAHRMLIIDGVWVRLRPRDYQVLTPLLEHFSCPVSVETICHDGLGCTYSETEMKRVYHAIDRLRSQLGAFGLAITSLNKKRGYMLWCGTAETVGRGGETSR